MTIIADRYIFDMSPGLLLYFIPYGEMDLCLFLPLQYFIPFGEMDLSWFIFQLQYFIPFGEDGYLFISNYPLRGKRKLTINLSRIQNSKFKIQNSKFQSQFPLQLNGNHRHLFIQCTGRYFNAHKARVSAPPGLQPGLMLQLGAVAQDIDRSDGVGHSF